jgi:hypothetical protein
MLLSKETYSHTNRIYLYVAVFEFDEIPSQSKIGSKGSTRPRKQEDGTEQQVVSSTNNSTLKNDQAPWYYNCTKMLCIVLCYTEKHMHLLRVGDRTPAKTINK